MLRAQTQISVRHEESFLFAFCVSFFVLSKWEKHIS